MSLAHDRRGQMVLACDGRQHPDGEHECSKRFHPRVPAGQRTAGWIRLRALHQGWTRPSPDRDLCPYHSAPDCFCIGICTCGVNERTLRFRQLGYRPAKEPPP